MSRFWRAEPFVHARVLSWSMYVLTAGLLVVTAYRHIFLDTDPFHCTALLNHGQWLDDKFQNWQPPGCMLHDYEAKDIASCLNSRKILFVGDSTIRQVFWAAAKKLAPHDADKHRERAQKHSSYSYKRRNVTLEFWWDPFLNSTALKAELRFRRKKAEGVPLTSFEEQSGATATLLGAGLWHARHLGHEAFEQFQRSINDTVNSIWPPGFNTSQPYRIREHMLVAPVDIPLYDRLSPDRERTLLPGVIEDMNLHLQNLTLHKGVPVVWSFKNMTAGRIDTYENSGIHVVDSVASRRADILLNMFCNVETLHTDGNPYDRTCCNSAPTVHYRGGFPAMHVGGFVFGMYIYRHTSLRPLAANAVVSAWSAMFLAVGYANWADRTTVFSKVQKQYSVSDFLTLVGLGFLLGLFTMKRSAFPSRQKWTNSAIGPLPFLSRDQTDEWKGWMQLMILIYHYTGASKELWIYEVVRVLVASYLFLTGYGHARYFYEKGDYSFRRVCAVLVRLNLLSCMLPYAMSTEYIFYYFAPLASFWFLVVYATMRTGSSRNHQWQFLIAKILLSAGLVKTFLHTPGLLEAVLSILRLTCRIQWNVYEVRFRFTLDLYIVYVGVLLAILFSRLEAARSTAKQEHNGTQAGTKYHASLLRLLTMTIAATIIVAYAILARQFPNKYAYNAWHPYISFLPVLAYAILRSSHPVLMAYHSRAFAWLGRCSLETFTLQYHIWLAGDTKGLLSTGLFHGDGTFFGDRWRDFALLTSVFLFVSWKVSLATAFITRLIVEDAGRTTPGSLESDELKLPEHNAQSASSRPSSAGGGESSRDRQLGRILWPVSLGKRIAVLFVIMWFLNMTSYPIRDHL